MKTITSAAAREYRLKEWADQIRDCNDRPEGITVKEWCQEHQLSVANYYYRLRQVRKACLDTLYEGQDSQNVVPVPVGFLEPAPSPSSLTLKVGKIDIHITEGVSPELLKMALEVVMDVK